MPAVAALVDVVDADTFDIGAKMREAVDRCFLRSPIESVLPIAQQ